MRLDNGAMLRLRDSLLVRTQSFNVPTDGVSRCRLGLRLHDAPVAHMRRPDCQRQDVLTP